MGAPFFCGIKGNYLQKNIHKICEYQKKVVILRGKGFGEVAPNSEQHSGGRVRRDSAE
jgi:hypothetical protein